MNIADMSDLEILSLRWQRSLKKDALEKTIFLLKQYAGLDEALATNVYAAKLARFFKGNWNTHHGDAVVRVLQSYKPETTLSDVENVKRLLAALRKEIGIDLITKGGSLDLIVQVIKQETEVDFYKMPLIERRTMGPFRVAKDS